VRPGEIIPGDEGAVRLFGDRPVTSLSVVNTGDRPVQVGSHFHFAEANPALGSLLGIGTFTALSFLGAPPVWWGVIVAVASGERLERVQTASAGVVQAEGHAANSKADPAPARSPGQGAVDPTDTMCRECRRGTSSTRPSMEVLRWLLFFAIALFLIVAAIFFVLGRPPPFPRF
jgi:hypothetical protein